MPTYEYTCKTCGENFEVFQSFSDKPLKKHKGCGGQLQKVFHVRGIVFKGSGFYATDAKAASSTKGGSDEGAGSDSKKEAKPDAKKEAKPHAKKATAATAD
jgi:putative FmdB family regulatory protein